VKGRLVIPDFAVEFVAFDTKSGFGELKAVVGADLDG